MLVYKFSPVNSQSYNKAANARNTLGHHIRGGIVRYTNEEYLIS